MIRYITGNIFESSAQAIVNTVNTVGVMGKGLALQFKKNFPNNYEVYKEACTDRSLQIGELLVFEEESLTYGKKIIINFPTKKHWRNPSQYEYIEAGLDRLILLLQNKSIQSIAIPPLGAGNGGLDWTKVKSMIEDKLKGLGVDIQVYEPL